MLFLRLPSGSIFPAFYSINICHFIASSVVVDNFWLSKRTVGQKCLFKQNFEVIIKAVTTLQMFSPLPLLKGHICDFD